MFSKLYSAALLGMEACLISVEADVSDGLPQMNMVGVLGTEVREAKDRVWTAIKNLGIRLPARRITINLSPADIRKEGTAFDLPIAAAVLMSFGYLPETFFKDTLLVGELGLNGQLCRINGVLPIVFTASQYGLKRCIIPKENAKEGSMIKGIEVMGISTLQELIFLANEKKVWQPEKFSFCQTMSSKEVLDFSDVNGQKSAKRAIEIAVAGMHNLLMIGSPGSGKTMLAKRIPGIMPEFSFEECMEVSKVYSVAGLLNDKDGLVKNRPFRSPHHTLTSTALIGGGRLPKPGEISLASHGVLFLDELTEFHKDTLEMLRQPLEEHQITISRIYGTYRYPADFILVAAMNPCACGYYPNRNFCHCTERQIYKYLNRVSRPFLDRIDLCVETQPLEYEQLISKEKQESSREIRKRVEIARNLQKERYQKENITCNGELTPQLIEKYIVLSKREQNYLEEIFQRLSLTARSYHKIIKTARTIADLEESKEISLLHLSEAACYRSMDKKFWKQ